MAVEGSAAPGIARARPRVKRGLCSHSNVLNNL